MALTPSSDDRFMQPDAVSTATQARPHLRLVEPTESGTPPGRAPAVGPFWPRDSTHPDELAAFFDHRGQLRPPLRQGELPADPAIGLAELAAELALANEIEQHAMALNTRLSYGGHVRAWQLWCRAQGAVMLPADPEDLARHLTGYAIAVDAEQRICRDEDGALINAVAAVTVGLRVSAIDKLHELAGLNKPGHDVRIKRLVGGIRRLFSVHPEHAKAALDLAGLRRVLTVCRAPRSTQLRWQAIVLAQMRTDATAGQLSRLRWSDVRFRDSSVELTLTPHRRGGPARTVSVPHAADPVLCLSSVLRRLRQSAVDPRGRVLADAANRPMTQSAVHKVLAKERLPRSGDALQTADPADPTGEDTALRQALAGRRQAETLVLRNTALLTCGWFGALRRSNIVALNWGDLRQVGREWEVTHRRSKTNQEGRREIMPLPWGADSEICPATAMTDWWRLVSDTVGGDPIRVCRDRPVFTALDRHGNVRNRAGRPARMTGAAVNELIQDLVIRAGLTPVPEVGTRNPYGGHSLRAGFISEGLRDDKLSFMQVAEVSGHVDPRSLKRYHREVNRMRHSPARRLLGGDGTAPTPLP